MFEPHRFMLTPSFIVVTAIFLIVLGILFWKRQERFMALVVFGMSLLWLSTLFQLL